MSGCSRRGKAGWTVVSRRHGFTLDGLVRLLCELAIWRDPGARLFRRALGIVHEQQRRAGLHAASAGCGARQGVSTQGMAGGWHGYNFKALGYAGSDLNTGCLHTRRVPNTACFQRHTTSHATSSVRRTNQCCRCNPKRFWPSPTVRSFTVFPLAQPEKARVRWYSTPPSPATRKFSPTRVIASKSSR